MKIVYAALHIIWYAKTAILGIAGITIAISGFAAIIYVVIWIMAIGGITDLINIFKSSRPATLGEVGFSLAKIFFSVPVGLFLGQVIAELFDHFDATSWENSSLNINRSKSDVVCGIPHSTNNDKEVCSLTNFDWTMIPNEWHAEERKWQSWTKEEDQLLLLAKSAGCLTSEIAKYFGRSEGAINTRLNRLR